MPGDSLQEKLQLALGSAFTLQRELGGGGMSRVFVARDETLGRDVVVKVLAPELAEGLSAERFTREIRLAARLQHPHIVPLLAAGTMTGGLPYYTMPFVEGESLRQRLAREGELPAAQAVSILRDVLRALAYAHEKGVVHRDVKPDNVMLSGGSATVTDFGVARAVSESVTSGDATTLTRLGVALGTPAYMAPEQAAAEPTVDHRADLYATGCVAYELLTGSVPFAGRPGPALLAAHVTETPEHIVRRRPSLSPALGALIMRLLEKRPSDRPQAAIEVLQSLDAVDVTSGSTGAVVRPATAFAGSQPGRRSLLREPLVVTLALLSLVALGGLAWTTTRSSGSARSPLRARLALQLPEDARIVPGSVGSSLAFSPDGSTIAYVGGTGEPQLYLRRLDEMTPRPLAGTAGALNPQFSPDGQWIAFTTSNAVIRKVRVGGGDITQVATQASRMAWASDGSMIFSRPVSIRPTGLWRVLPGGRVEEYVAPDSTRDRHYGSPALLADSQTVVFTVLPMIGTARVLAAARLDDRRAVLLGFEGLSPFAMPDGSFGFVRRDGSVAVGRLDRKTLRMVSEPVTVLEGVATKAGSGAEIAVSPEGVLVYLSGAVGSEIVRVNRRGEATVIGPQVREYGPPRLSPDGRRIAVAIGGPSQRDIWVYDMASSTLTRLTESGRTSSPEWSPDGRRILWTGSETGEGAPGEQPRTLRGTWWRPWDASAPSELLVPDALGAKFVAQTSFVTGAYQGGGTGIGGETRLFPVGTNAGMPTRRLLPATATYRQHRPSPDGEWIAYVSDEGGTSEVFVQRISGTGGRFQVSTGSGAEPMWARDGSELFYRSGAGLVAARLSLKSEFTVLRRDTLFAMDTPSGGVEAAYDVAPDGQGFVMGRPAGAGAAPVLVIGWADEVRERTAALQRP